jgi:hypothetical protein
VEVLDGGGVEAHIVCGPVGAERLALRGELSDERGPSRRRTPRRAVRGSEPHVVRRPHGCGVELGEQRAPKVVGGEDVEAVIADVGGSAGDRVECPLDLRPDAWLVLAPARACPGRLGGAGEVEEVGALGVVELERPGQCLQDALGGAAHVSAFKARVVLDAHAGQHGDLFAAQPGNATSTVGRQPGKLWREPGAARGQELADLGLGLRSAWVSRTASGSIGSSVSRT